MTKKEGPSHHLSIHNGNINPLLLRKYCVWIRDCLINRSDAYVLNLANGQKYSPVDLGADMSGMAKPKRPVTPDTIIRHCLGVESISLYAIARDNTCRWVCLDVDDHTGTKAKLTSEYAFKMAAEIRELGFEPLIENSDGGGGWHIWILFSQPILSEVAYRFGHWLIETHCPAKDYSVAAEAFPAQECLTETSRYGSAVRVPGLHQERGVWNRILSDGQLLDLPSNEAIQRLTSYDGDSPILIPREARSYKPEGYRNRLFGGRREFPNDEYDEDDPSIPAVFTRRHSWEMILRPHGWQPVQVGGKVTYWRRPGKYMGGISATTGYCGRRLHVFSDDDGCRPFVRGETYSKWQAHCLLHFGGDSDAAEGDYLFNNNYPLGRNNDEREEERISAQPG